MTDDDGYDVRWKNHLTDVFGVLRLIRTKDAFSDVILYCDNKQYLVHKVILAACSTFFERMLSALPFEKSKVLVMTDTDSNILELLLKFMYDGEVYVDSALLDEFITVGEKLEIRGMKRGGIDEEAAPGNGTLNSTRKRPASSPAPTAVKDDDQSVGRHDSGDGGDPLTKRFKTTVTPSVRRVIRRLPPNVTIETGHVSASRSPAPKKSPSVGFQETATLRKVCMVYSFNKNIH